MGVRLLRKRQDIVEELPLVFERGAATLKQRVCGDDELLEDPFSCNEERQNKLTAGEPAIIVRPAAQEFFRRTNWHLSRRRTIRQASSLS